MFKANLHLLKKNNFCKTFDILTESNWLIELFDLKIIKFLSTLKYGKSIFYRYLKLRFILTQKVSIPFLCFVLTTRCTLNCKNCCHYMPSYTKETHSNPITFEQFKIDLDKLLQAVDEIHAFQITGGEPFLVKDLPEIISYAKSKKQIKHIFVPTNCTILPSTKLLKTLQKTKTVVQISDYRNVDKINVFYNEIKNIFKENKIRYCNWQEDKKISFRSLPKIFEDYPNDEILKTRFQCCWDKRCNTFCDGKFYLCPTHLHIERNIKPINSHIDVRKNNKKNNQKSFIKFYQNSTFKPCGFCHWDNVEYNLPIGEQKERINTI